MIFKAYDIRGIYPNEINEEVFKNLGRAIITYFKDVKKVLVGNDVRISSISLKQALLSSLSNYNLKIYDIGYVSTSTINFLCKKFDLALMITASHNPKEYNGLKIYYKGNEIGYENGLNEIEKIYYSKNFLEESGKAKIINAENLKLKHLNFLLKKAKELKNLKIAFDFSNGCANFVFKDLVNSLEIEKIYLNDFPDGNFPAHEPEPNEKNLQELIRIVKEKNLEFGVGFDGDADRIVFVKDRIIRGDELAFFLTKVYKYKKIVIDFSFPEIFKDYFKNVLVSKVGRTNIIKTMKENNATAGFEMSGHVYFKETNYLEDTFLTFIKFAKKYEKFDKVLKKYEKLEFKQFKIPKVDISNLEEKAKNYGEVIIFDGFKLIIDKHNEILIRPSNTEPIIRIFIYFKDKYEELVKLLKDLGINIL